MAILFSLMFLGVFATAIPTPAIKYPEIIPGPGLPSLSSLNVTSEELWTRALPVSGMHLHFIFAWILMRSPLPNLKIGRTHNLTMSVAGKPIEARANFPFCGPDDAYGPVGAIAACFNYLNSLGDQPCVSSDGPRPVNYCGTADTGGKVVGIGMGRSVTNTWYVLSLASRPLMDKTQLLTARI